MTQTSSIACNQKLVDRFRLSKSARIAGLTVVILSAIFNLRYMILDIKTSIAVFNAIYDPLPNLLHEKVFFNSSTLQKCDFSFNGSNNCTLSNYDHHLAWTVSFYKRFAFENDKAITRRSFLYIHVFCNTVGLLLCTLVQFNSYFHQKNHLKYHRYCGRISIILLYVGTISSFVLASDMSSETNYGGSYAQYGFYFLGLTLLVPITIGYYYIFVNKDKTLHQLWMIRSNGALWGSFAIFRCMEFLLSPILQCFLSLSVLLDIWLSGIIGLLISEWCIRKYREDLILNKSHAS